MREKLFGRLSTICLCWLRIALALALMVSVWAGASRILLTVFWGLYTAVWFSIGLPRDREDIHLGMYSCANLLMYITAAIKTHYMIPVALEYGFGLLADTVFRYRHRNKTGATLGIFWHDCAASIAMVLSLFGILIEKSMTDYNFLLLSVLCLVMRVISQVAYIQYHVTHDREDPNPRIAMTVIEFQAMVMDLFFALSTFVLLFSKRDPYLSVVLPGWLYVFLQFAAIVGFIGIPAFFWGERIPRDRLNPERFPFAVRKWENDGKIYEKIYVHKWKERTPDMSRYMSQAFSKQGSLTRDPAVVRRMILETCSAECVHWILIGCSWFYLIGMDRFGLASMLLYIVGNIISIIIQRYNRPRLMMIMKRLEKHHA